MLFLISNAYAQTAAAPKGGDFASTLIQAAPMILIFVVGFFLVIRPQMKKQKELRTLLDNLAAGDEVITAGGLLGKVVRLKDNHIELQVAKGVEVQMQRSAVSQVLPKGTLRF